MSGLIHVTGKLIFCRDIKIKNTESLKNFCKTHSLYPTSFKSLEDFLSDMFFFFSPNKTMLLQNDIDDYPKYLVYNEKCYNLENIEENMLEEEGFESEFINGRDIKFSAVFHESFSADEVITDNFNCILRQIGD